MPTSFRTPTVMPIGYQQFHKQKFVNYQLNRAHALGYASTEELRAAAERIQSFTDCVDVFTELSVAAEQDGRLRHATSYLRIAEFFTPQEDSAKTTVYRRYRDLFDAGFSDAGVVRSEIPYSGSSIPAYRLDSRRSETIGTVLFHGGFDSLIEEFFPIWERFAEAGFDVVAFEGPGQGGARILGGLTFDHDWERPVAAVLDHFGIQRASLVGFSMGGYWALRAAGRDARIQHVVSWSPVYDWMQRVPGPVRAVAQRMFRFRGFMNWSIGVRARLVPVLGHAVRQAMYLADGDEPMDAVDWFLGMNADHLGSELVTQPVFLVAGEHDDFQPPTLAYKQRDALVNAASVDLRVFTRDEDADRHCQMGNLPLAVDVVTGWLTTQWRNVGLMGEAEHSTSPMPAGRPYGVERTTYDDQPPGGTTPEVYS